MNAQLKPKANAAALSDSIARGPSNNKHDYRFAYKLDDVALTDRESESADAIITRFRASIHQVCNYPAGIEYPEDASELNEVAYLEGFIYNGFAGNNNFSFENIFCRFDEDDQQTCDFFYLLDHENPRELHAEVEDRDVQNASKGLCLVTLEALPAWRGKGIGSFLLATILQQNLHDAGWAALRASPVDKDRTMEENTREMGSQALMRYYEKFGFKQYMKTDTMTLSFDNGPIEFVRQCLDRKEF